MRRHEKSIILIVIALLWLAACAHRYISAEARARFRQISEPVSLTLFPFRIIRGREIENDSLLAQQLYLYLARQKIVREVVMEKPLDFPVEWGMNQAKIWRGSGQQFAELIKSMELQSDYALLVEILCNSAESWVGGVHYYLCDSEGRLAEGGLSNSHHAGFKAVNPHDRTGGYSVLTRMLREECPQLFDK